MKWLKRILLGAGALLGAAALAVGGLFLYQGGGAPDLDGVTVSFDANGIPTIDAPDWERLVEAQGFVVASQRLWQMDLGRRAAGGRLAEWFGPAAVDHDRGRRMEDRLALAEALVEALPEGDRRYCEAYARGVNAFIDGRPWGWGLEYLLLQVAPEPWRCADTLLMSINMSEQLSDTHRSDELRGAWRGRLDPDWEAFLFPWTHPWSRPLFGPAADGPALPPAEDALPPVDLSEVRGVTLEPSAPTPGSNAWAWSDGRSTFLANDPHLGANVPHLWYLVRLRVSAEDWAVGVSIPGMPGVVLGMNPALAWGFTNLGEDVDDLLIEDVNRTVEQYVLEIGADLKPVWAPIERRAHTIRVKGGDDVTVESLHTARGPLLERSGRWYTRQWLPFLGESGLPTVALNQAHDWGALNAAIDAFPYPAQNVMVAERGGAVGYRASGRAIRRSAPGGWPAPAVEGAWLGVEPPSERPRARLTIDDAPIWIATANQRIWSGADSNRWSNEGRADRLNRVLDGALELTRADMEALQMDTESRLHALILGWVGARAGELDPARAARWAAWDGQAASDPQTFTEALSVESELRQILIARATEGASIGAPPEVPYRWRLDDAWLIVTLEEPEGVARFGLDPAQLAAHLMRAAARERPLYTEENRWRAQHPFVGRVPVVGALFAIPEPEQAGYSGVLRVEQPRFGASTRLVWSLSDPADSTWITPVGQSGHVNSPHYSDLQALYMADQRLKVFPEPAERASWGLSD